MGLIALRKLTGLWRSSRATASPEIGSGRLMNQIRGMFLHLQSCSWADSSLLKRRMRIGSERGEQYMACQEPYHHQSQKQNCHQLLKTAAIVNLHLGGPMF